MASSPSRLHQGQDHPSSARGGAGRSRGRGEQVCPRGVRTHAPGLGRAAGHRPVRCNCTQTAAPVQELDEAKALGPSRVCNRGRRSSRRKRGAVSGQLHSAWPQQAQAEASSGGGKGAEGGTVVVGRGSCAVHTGSCCVVAALPGAHLPGRHSARALEQSRSAVGKPLGAAAPALGSSWRLSGACLCRPKLSLPMPAPSGSLEVCLLSLRLLALATACLAGLACTLQLYSQKSLGR